MLPKRLRLVGVGLLVIAIAAAISAALLRRQRSVPAESEPAERLGKLKSVPYTMTGTEDVSRGRSGVVVYDTERAQAGYNIYSVGISPRVLLIDMQGMIVHEWLHPEKAGGYWHHAEMLRNGDLIVVNEYHHVLRLDWSSNLIWKTEMPAHHDLAQLPDGTLYVIGRERRVHRGLVVTFPTVERLASDGEPIETWRAYDHLEGIKQAFDRRSFLDTILDSLLAANSWIEVYAEIGHRAEATTSEDKKTEYDHFHMNTISLLPATPLGTRDRRFREGNVLICFRNVNQIGVLDGDTMEPVWAWGEGVLEWPHHPTMLPNGNILVFDNGSWREDSRVLEIDPTTGKVVWEYAGDPPGSFYTYDKGSAQRLPNGNTLISEGNKGRVIEVTPDGEIVWEWLNPIRRGKRRVQVYRMMRLPPDVVEPLLNQ